MLPTTEEIKALSAKDGCSWEQSKVRLTRKHHIGEIMAAKTQDELQEAVVNALAFEWGAE